ncbi:MAG: GNAT family N-acetyltransferase [Candidatus Hodarchaeota archaeon]
MKPSLDHSKRESIKLRRLFFRKKEENVIGTEEDKPEMKYKYIVLKMSWDQALNVQEHIEKDIIENNNFLKNVKIRNFNPDIDADGFVRAYNRAFITAPDPYRSLTMNDIKHFNPDSTFVAILYGKIIGFVFLTIEPLIKNGKEVGKQGVIAGLGVDPHYRRKKIGFLLGSRAAEFFSNSNVSELVCEVYHDNSVSYSFIRNFGFTRTGTIYI